MPWKESSVMDERLRFVARILEGEPMTAVCLDFGISRMTGYKLFERYKVDGPVALADRSRRPVRFANQLPAQIESLIVTAKRDKPHWGVNPIDPRGVRHGQRGRDKVAPEELPLASDGYIRHRRQQSISSAIIWLSLGHRRTDAYL